MLLWFHPIFQTLLALLALYVLWLGVARAAARHFGQKAVFRWERHVLLGKVVVVGWALGGLGGLGMAYISFGSIPWGSLHLWNGAAILVLLLVAWLTGTRMDRRRNQSDVLPVVHMTNNLVLLILAAIQLITGIGIVRGVLLQ